MREAAARGRVVPLQTQARDFVDALLQDQQLLMEGTTRRQAIDLGETLAEEREVAGSFRLGHQLQEQEPTVPDADLRRIGGRQTMRTTAEFKCAALLHLLHELCSRLGDACPPRAPCTAPLT